MHTRWLNAFKRLLILSGLGQSHAIRVIWHQGKDYPAPQKGPRGAVFAFVFKAYPPQEAQGKGQKVKGWVKDSGIQNSGPDTLDRAAWAA